MKAESTWAAVALAVVGLATAIVRVIAGRKRAEPPPAPVQPAPPIPPAPAGRRDDAITAAEHERVRQEAARRAQPPPAADLTKIAPSPPSDNAIEPRDLQ
jgi:hypothetical protein